MSAYRVGFVLGVLSMGATWVTVAVLNKHGWLSIVGWVAVGLVWLGAAGFFLAPDEEARRRVGTR